MATTGRNIIDDSQALSLPVSPPSVLDSMTATLPPVPEINPLDVGGPLSPPPPVQFPAPAPPQGLLGQEGLLGEEGLLGGQGQAPAPAPPPLQPAPYDPYPSVQNDDGTVSNVRLASVNMDGVERVIPTMWHGEQRGIDEAIDNAKRVGPNRFPSFSTTDEAEQWISQNHGKAAGILPEPSDVHPDTKSVQDAWSGVDETTKQMLRPMTAAEVAVAANRGAIRRADDGDTSAPTEDEPADSWAKMLMETPDEVLEQIFKTPDMAAAMRRIEEEVKGGDLTSWGRTWGGWFPYEAIAAGTPYLAGGAALGKGGFISKAGLNIMKGTADEEDYDIFARFVRVGQLKENRSWMENSAELMSTIPGIGIEFALAAKASVATLGVAAPAAFGAFFTSMAGRKGLKLLGYAARKKLLKAYRKVSGTGAAAKNVAGISQATRIPAVGKKLAAQTAGKLGSAIGRSGLMIVTNPSMTMRMLGSELQDDYGFDKDEAGKLAVMHADPDDPDTFMENVTNGMIRSMVANFSEQLGGIGMPLLKRGAFGALSKLPLAKQLGGITSATAQRAFKAGVMRKFFELNPTSAGRAKYAKLMAKAGIQGPLEEILEEYADMAINAGLGIEEFQDFTWTQILEMGVAFSVVPMGKKILTKGGSKILGEISAPGGQATWDEVKKQDEEYNAFAAPLRQEDVEALENGELSQEQVVIKEQLRRSQWLAEMEDEVTEITGEDGVVFHVQADGSWTDTKEATEASEKFDSLHDLAAREVEQQDVQEVEQEAPAATTESLLDEIQEEEAARDQLQEQLSALEMERGAALEDTSGTFDTTRLDEEIENVGLEINAANEKLESLNAQLSATETETETEAETEVEEEDQKPEPPPEVVVTTERTKGKPTRITVTAGDSMAQVQRIDGKWYRVDAEGNIVNAETGVQEEAAEESEALTDLRAQRAELQSQLEDIESDPKARETPFEGRPFDVGLHIESLANDIAAVDKLIEAEMRAAPLGETRDEAVSRLGDILSPGRQQQATTPAPAPAPAPTPRSAGHRRIDSLISALEQQDRADARVRLEAARRIKARIQGVPDITEAQVDQLLKNEAQIVVVDQLLEKGVSEEQAQKHQATRDRLVLSNKQILGTAGKPGKEGTIETDLTRDRFSKNEVNMIRRMFRGAGVKVVPGSEGSEVEVEVAGKKVRIARVREPLTKRTFGAFTPEDRPDLMGAGVYLGQEDLVGAKLNVGGKEIDAESIILLTGVSDLTTIPHEVFHLAMDLVLTKSEQDYLFRKYAPGESRDPQTGRYSRDAEETVAEAYQAYGLSQAKNPIFRKFADFWRNLADRLFLNFDSREARRIFRDLPRLIETAREPGEGGAEGVKLQTISKRQRKAYVTRQIDLVKSILNGKWRDRASLKNRKIPVIEAVRSEAQKGSDTVVVFEAASWLENEIRSNMKGFGPLPIPGAGVRDLSADEKELLAEAMAAEGAVAFESDITKEDRDKAIGWYGRIIEEALDELSFIFPELASTYNTDPAAKKAGIVITDEILPNGKTTGEARLVFKLMLAITSDGEKVGANFRNAINSYSIWRDSGKIKGKFKRGSLPEKMEEALDLIDTYGWEATDKFLAAKFKVKYMNQELGLDIKSELVDTEVPAASMIGPKLGSFFNNLNQRFDTLTMDLWWSRTIGRLRGNLLSRNVPLAKENSTETKKQKKKTLPSFVSVIDPANVARYLGKGVQTEKASVIKGMSDEKFASSNIVRYAVALNAKNGSIFTSTATSNIYNKELKDRGIEGREVTGTVKDLDKEGKKYYNSLLRWAKARAKEKDSKWLEKYEGTNKKEQTDALMENVLKAALWRQQERAAVTTDEFKAAGRIYSNMFGVYATPKNGNDRVQQREITAKAIDKFSEEHAEDIKAIYGTKKGAPTKITMADFQAMMWYHEKQLWTNLGVKGTGITTSEGEDSSEETETDLDYGTAAREVTKEHNEGSLELQGEKDESGAFPKPRKRIASDAKPKRPAKGVRRKLRAGVTEEGDGAVDRGRITDKNIRAKLEQLEKVENEALEKEIETRAKMGPTPLSKRVGGVGTSKLNDVVRVAGSAVHEAEGNVLRPPTAEEMRARVREFQENRAKEAEKNPETAVGLPAAKARGKFQEVPEATNRRYMELALDPEANRDELQKMVDDAAKAAGYDSPKVYHGTGNTITEFDPKKTGQGNDQIGSGFYFTTNQDEAAGYQTATLRDPSTGMPMPKPGGTENPNTITAYLKIENPIRVDGSNLRDTNLSLTENQAFEIMRRAPLAMHPEESPLGDWAEEYWDRGPDENMLRSVASNYTGQSLISLEADWFRNDATAFRESLSEVLGVDGVEMDFGDGHQHHVAWFPSQIKSADPVTKDDAGNVVPLTERFDPSKEDVRFQTTSQAEMAKTARPWAMKTKVYTKAAELIREDDKVLDYGSADEAKHAPRREAIEKLGAKYTPYDPYTEEPVGTKRDLKGKDIVMASNVLNVQIKAGEGKGRRKDREDRVRDAYRIALNEMAGALNQDGTLITNMPDRTAREMEEKAKVDVGWMTAKQLQRDMAHRFWEVKREGEVVIGQYPRKVDGKKTPQPKAGTRDTRFQPVPEAVNRRYMELARDPEANRGKLQAMVDLAAKRAGYWLEDEGRRGGMWAYRGVAITPARVADELTPEDLRILEGKNVADALSGESLVEKRGDVVIYESIHPGLRERRYVKLGDDGEAIGYITVLRAFEKTAPDTVVPGKEIPSIKSMHVAPDHRGKGLASELITMGLSDHGGRLNPDWINSADALKAYIRQTEVLGYAKSTKPVTKDDAGNVIPLSERFDPSTEDTRFQQITPDQWRKVMERRAKRRDRGEHRAEDSDLAQALFTPESVESLRAVDEIRGSAGYQGREVKAEDQEVRERAEKFLEDAKTDETKQARVDELIKKIKRGEDLEPWETWAARKLLEAQSWNAIIEHQKFGRDTDSEKAVEEALLMWSGYRDTGTQWSQTGRMRQDQEKSPSVANRKAALDALLAFTVPEKNRLRKLKKILRDNPDGSVAYEHARKGIDEVLASAKKRVLGLKKKLKAAGIDLASPTNNWKDPRFVANVINQISIADSTYFDKQFEFFRSGLMSGTGTVLRNVVGNTLNATWELTAQRFTSAFLNTVTPGGRAGGATFGEFKHIIKGLIQSMPEAIENFRESWAMERVVFSDEVGSATDRFGSARLELTGKGRRGPKIAGRRGRAWRWSQRMALSMDQFFQTAIATQHAQVMAHRIALREKKQGQAMTNRMIELTSDRQSEAWVAAYDEALRLTYQEKLDPVGEFLLKGRSLLPGIRYKLPFFTTPWNIARVAGKKTPIGSLRLAWKLGRLGRAKMGWDSTYDYHTMNNLGSVSTRQAVVEDVAEQLIAWTIFMSMVAYAEGPDEEDGLPNITGSAEKHSSKRGEQYRVAAPYTIRVPFTNERISYQGFSPLDISLATMVDAVDAIKEAKNDKATMAALADGLKSAVNLFSDQSSMRGFKDIITLLTEPTESGVMRFLSDTGVAFVPNIVRQASRESDPFYREYKTGGEIGTGEWWTSGMTMLGKKALPLAQLAPSPKVELWGSDVKRGNWVGNPVGDWLLKMSITSMTRIYNFDPSDRHKLNTMIRIWNVTNPNDGLYPTQPKKNWKRDGETYVMSDTEYHRFNKLAGEYALERASGWGFDYENPTERDIERIKKFIRRGRSRAKDTIIRERRDREDRPVDRAG